MTSEHGGVEATPGKSTKQQQDHVLIVDEDEQFAGDTVSAVLSLGLGASSVGSISEALEAAERQHPRLLITDIDLGSPLAGLRLAETVRSRWGSSIIVMSTCNDREAIAAIAALDPSGVLCKPFHWKQFEMTLRHALERRASGLYDGATAKSDLPDHSDASRADLEAALRRIAAEVSRVGFGHLLPEYMPNHEWLAAMRPREREVVTLLLQHQRVPAIARTLAISPATVRNHLKSVFRQMGVHSQQELLLILQQKNPHQPSGVSGQSPTPEA